MSDRNNFATMAQLEAACSEARLILRRKNPTQVSLRHAAEQLNKAVRTLRSWLNTRNDELRHARARVYTAATFHEPSTDDSGYRVT
jgi:hypothetical protein